MAAIDQLVEAADALVAVDPQALADGETIELLQRQLHRVDAVLTRATAAFDAAGTWETDGARSAAAWVSARCRLPMTTARRRVAQGRQLRHLPLVEAAWLAGEIGNAHVELFCRARRPAVADLMNRDEAVLVGQAKRLRFGQFVRSMQYWSWRADPDGSDKEGKQQYERRRVHLSSSFEGCGVLDGLLDPISFAVVRGALERIEQELFDADWAEAKQRVGPAACAADLARTPAQRRADALVEMARRSQAMPEGARLPEPLFTVLVGYETFAGPICELANGTFVTPGALLRHLDRAHVERIVFDGPSRVIDVGVRRRLFSGATRRAVLVRDRECFSELCDVDAEHCEVDHVRPWAEGGATTVGNGRAACGWHNRHRHKRRR